MKAAPPSITMFLWAGFYLHGSWQTHRLACPFFFHLFFPFSMNFYAALLFSFLPPSSSLCFPSCILISSQSCAILIEYFIIRSEENGTVTRRWWSAWILKNESERFQALIVQTQFLFLQITIQEMRRGIIAWRRHTSHRKLLWTIRIMLNCWSFIL